MRLTLEEENAIDDLKRLAKRWPKSLWLFSANGTLCVMKYKKGRRRAILPDGGMDPTSVAEYISGIDNDGGDW